MGSAVEQLTGLNSSAGRFDIPHAELREKQVAALNERFQERKERIKLLAHRAGQAGLAEIRRLEDAVPLLFPHTAYKSYPESFLLDQRWEKLGKWLDTLSTYRVPELDFAQVADVDDWIGMLGQKGLYVSCSSGTTGKCAMLVASDRDIQWIKGDCIQPYLWGTDLQANRDRRIFALAAVASVPRNIASMEAWREAFQVPGQEMFQYPVPPITVGSLIGMVVLRKKIADGTASPSEMQAFEQTSAARQKAVDDAVGITAEAIVAARHDKLHIVGLWGGAYNVAKAVREMGYGARDFNPDNSIYVGGGLKRIQLPDDYREFVYETFNIAPRRTMQNYSMQELHSSMPRCMEGGRYHLPPWLVPLTLDKSGDHLLPIVDGEYEGRAAFFDLSIDARWGGIISGDRVSIDFSPCACGARGPSIRDNVVRYSDLEGDDKIGCAGTVDAYVRGVA